MKYNLLEPEDGMILNNNPRSHVLDKGGRIFFAKYNGEIVGTSSILKLNESTFELAKLGVTERCQLRG